ncbi:4-hydroxybenzoate octaprenyltransferase [Arenibaculum pallidiluteum]|uniref:4-hydroxybenzoate octaprenyltransferase n=1 Tax=Arenibaculum pallidiluteum TaxID=2812559 RepID=UPI001A972F48
MPAPSRTESGHSGIGHTDIVRGDWIDRYAPAGWRPYMRLARLDRPIGTWLLLFPGWWSIALAVEGWPDLRLMTLFGLGAVVMRGAGCVVNDILDRDFDARVERTRGRPIPSGQVSVRQALAFLAFLLLLGLAVLLQLRPAAIGLGVLSLALVFTYPLMKRITWWPQAFLGLTFNWGALMGWASVTGGLELPALVLYAAGIVWTLGYDTIYAHQDKEDDARIGVKSTALRLGAASRPWVAGFYAATAAGLVLTGQAAGLAGPWWLPLMAIAAAQLAWQVAGWRPDDPADCLLRFRSNRWFGWLVLAAIVAGRVGGGAP